MITLSLVCSVCAVHEVYYSVWSVCSVINKLHMECNMLQCRHKALSREAHEVYAAKSVCFIWSAIHCKWSIMYFKGECNALESEVQCTLREAYHWSARKCALRCTGNALHFDLGRTLSSRNGWWQLMAVCKHLRTLFFSVEERLMICLFHDLLNLVSFRNPNYWHWKIRSVIQLSW